MTLTRNIVRAQGVLGLYNGISASLLRQLTYSTARFGIYETAKQRISAKDGKPIPFYVTTLLAGLGGFAGGLVGNPADLVNVRMQNDIKLSPSQRRNYKNAIHGLWSVATKEGVSRLWAGASLNCTRSALMTIGQVAFYDQTKILLLATPYFRDNVNTHIVASLVAGFMATALTQPVDVLKTRAMSAKPGEIKSVLQLVKNTALEGPMAFFKGFVPAFTRLAPHSIITFLFLEQLRMNFGLVKIRAE